MKRKVRASTTPRRLVGRRPVRDGSIDKTISKSSRRGRSAALSAPLHSFSLRACLCFRFVCVIDPTFFFVLTVFIYGVFVLRMCRGCGKNQPMTSYVYNSPYHIPECNYAIDALTRIARGQGNHGMFDSACRLSISFGSCVLAALFVAIALSVIWPGESAWFAEKLKNAEETLKMVKHYQEFRTALNLGKYPPASRYQVAKLKDSLVDCMSNDRSRVYFQMLARLPARTIVFRLEQHSWDISFYEMKTNTAID
jgi:hypothetical protein